MTSAPTIVFDLDGTLVDTAPDLINALNFILDREGLPAVPLASARNMIGGGARRAGVPVIGVTFGYTDVPIADLKPDLLIAHMRELPGAVSDLIARPGDRYKTLV